MRIFQIVGPVILGLATAGAALGQPLGGRAPTNPFAPAGPNVAASGQGTVNAPLGQTFGTTTAPMNTPFGVPTAPAGVPTSVAAPSLDFSRSQSQAIRNRYPVISPYQNLYRFNPSGVDNYNLFVRPILEQQSINRLVLEGPAPQDTDAGALQAPGGPATVPSLTLPAQPRATAPAAQAPPQPPGAGLQPLEPTASQIQRQVPQLEQRVQELERQIQALQRQPSPQN